MDVRFIGAAAQTISEKWMKGGVQVLTGEDASDDGGQKTGTDQHQRDEAAALVSLQHHTHEQPHGAVNKQRGEETPQEHPVPHLYNTQDTE